MKLAHYRLALPLTGVAMVALAMSGCASTTQLSPAVQSDIQTAYTAICGTGGLLAAAQPFAAQANVATYYNEAVTLCANGVPTNEVVAGVDVFDLYIDISQALSKSKVAARAKALKARAHG